MFGLEPTVKLRKFIACMVDDFFRWCRAKDLNNLAVWQTRVVIWLAGVAVGLIVVLFAKMTDVAIAGFFGIQKAYWWAPLILTPVGGALIVWITSRWFVGARGSGIPQIIAALRDGHDQQSISVLVSLRIVCAKVVLGVGGLAAGFSSGREGPSVQVGAGVMHAFSRFLPANSHIDYRHMLLAGGAAGISAAFNTPLAGVVFAIEELGRRFEQKTNGVVITAIILSGLMSISIMGNYTYFGSLKVGQIGASIILPLLASALVCGVLGGVFSSILIKTSRPLPGWLGQFRQLHPAWWAAGCGLLVACLGVLSDGAAHGSGYLYTRQMLEGTISEPWIYAPVKYLATILTYLSGIPGGIFAPSLAIGAGIGHDLMLLFSGQFTEAAICALCMVGFLSAVTQAPITSFIIVMEMIDGHEMVLSLMAVALLATIVSRIFSPPLYETLATGFEPKKS